MNKLKITNKAGRFYVGANIPTPHWIPLPENLKTRDQVLDHLKGADVLYCDEGGRHCKTFDVYYFYKDDTSGEPLELLCKEDDRLTLGIDLPVDSNQTDIESWLLNRAKNEGYESAIITYQEPLIQ